MTPPAFVHLPGLQGRLIPAHACGLRLTDEVLAEWDAQARSQGLPIDWRLPDDDVERSRRQVLAGVSERRDDLLVFAYGSLMWNPGLEFAEVRRAHLPGFARRFALSTTIGRGTPHCPRLVLPLPRAATIASACGRIGSNREYLDQLVAQFGVLGIVDPYVHALAEMVQTAC